MSLVKETPPYYIANPIPFPCYSPVGLEVPIDFEEPKFDPAIHLQYEPPQALVDHITFRDHSFPLEQPKEFPGLAYTSPFRLLSAEGVRAMRKIISNFENHKLIRQTSERTPLCLRGLGYVSPFVRALNESTRVNDILERFSMEPLAPHSMPMNYSQINSGAIGLDRPVDSWHLDSVDFVLVIILSDTTGMEGGNLEVVRRPTDEAMTMLQEQQGKFSDDIVLKVRYPEAGYACFMQGCRMLHRVSPVKSAREPRLTAVNSYNSRNVFRKDSTRFMTFAEDDPQHVTPLEFARHKAWRVQGQLSFIIEKMSFPDPDDNESMTRHRKKVCDLLKQAAEELQSTNNVISGSCSDALGYYNETTAKMETSVKRHREPMI